MVIESLMDLIYGLFSVLTAGIELPNLPTDVIDVLDTYVSYVVSGLSIVATYVHLPFLLVLLGIVISVDVGVSVYRLVMFIIRKIPMLNIR